MIPYTGEDEMPRNCPKLSQWGFPLEVQFFWELSYGICQTLSSLSDAITLTAQGNRGSLQKQQNSGFNLIFSCFPVLLLCIPAFGSDKFSSTNC